MSLSDKTLIEWARAGAEGYAAGAFSSVEGLRLRDVELAGDVSTLMPMLYFLARFTFVADRESPTFVEIGTADGSSALPLLKAAAELGGHLHSVDPFACPDAHFLVDQFDYRASWTHHQVRSDVFFKTFHETIDFSFIDGDHAWPQVERDVENCWTRLAPNGIIWVSDYGVLPSDSPPYEHEDATPVWDGEELVDRHRYDQQCSNGIAKAIRRVRPRLVGAQMIHLPIWPNPSVLIRRPRLMEDL